MKPGDVTVQPVREKLPEMNEDSEISFFKNIFFWKGTGRASDKQRADLVLNETGLSRFCFPIVFVGIFPQIVATIVVLLMAMLIRYFFFDHYDHSWVPEDYSFMFKKKVPFLWVRPPPSRWRGLLLTQPLRCAAFGIPLGFPLQPSFWILVGRKNSYGPNR